MSSTPESINSYLITVRDDQSTALEALRATIKAMVPAATEGISYRLPAFWYKGKPLVGFGATKEHCALYLMSGSIVEQFAIELHGFDTSKGTIRFQPGHPLPDDLVRQLLAARIAEIESAKN